MPEIGDLVDLIPNYQVGTEEYEDLLNLLESVAAEKIEENPKQDPSRIAVSLAIQAFFLGRAYQDTLGDEAKFVSFKITSETAGRLLEALLTED